MNTHEEKWPNMNKNHENGSCHMPGRDTQGSLLRAGLAGLAAGLAGWPVREGRRREGPKLDIRWQWAVNHLQHACTVVPVVIITSSTAQGGGGSFKNRKPIGEVGCCESGMAGRIHWWTERCLRSPLFRSLSLTIYLPTCLPTYLPIYLLCIYLSIDLSLSLFHLITYLITYLSIYLSVYLSIYLSLSFICLSV